MSTMQRRMTEGGWVEDRRPGKKGRRGQVLVLSQVHDWALISWGPHLAGMETVEGLGKLLPVRGPVGTVEDLLMTPPPCPICAAELVPNGSGWGCTGCETRWQHDGTQGTRVCACGADAKFIDIDGAARCGHCTTDGDTR